MGAAAVALITHSTPTNDDTKHSAQRQPAIVATIGTFWRIVAKDIHFVALELFDAFNKLQPMVLYNNDITFFGFKETPCKNYLTLRICRRHALTFDTPKKKHFSGALPRTCWQFCRPCRLTFALRHG